MTRDYHQEFKAIDNKPHKMHVVQALSMPELREAVRPFAVNGWEAVDGMFEDFKGRQCQIVMRQPDVPLKGGE